MLLAHPAPLPFSILDDVPRRLTSEKMMDGEVTRDSPVQIILHALSPTVAAVVILSLAFQ
jgi:hypothetical protein